MVMNELSLILPYEVTFFRILADHRTGSWSTITGKSDQVAAFIVLESKSLIPQDHPSAGQSDCTVATT